MLTIIVNGTPRETAATTLGALCRELGLGSAKIATAVNGAFVPQGRRAEVTLAEQDRVEIVAPRQGG